MKNRINSSRSLAAINRALAAVGESVDRDSFAPPVAPVVECDEVAAINRSLGVHGEAVDDNAFFEPQGDRIEMGLGPIGELRFDGYSSVASHLAGHDRFEDVRGLGEGLADMVRGAIRDNAFFEPDSDVVVFGNAGHRAGHSLDGYDARHNPLLANLLGHDLSLIHI